MTSSFLVEVCAAQESRGVLPTMKTPAIRLL